MIATSKGIRNIADIYNQQFKKGTDGRISRFRVFNMDTLLFEYASGKVLKSGEKDVLLVSIQNSSGTHEIKATKEHKFLTKDGWKKLSDLYVGDFINKR